MTSQFGTRVDLLGEKVATGPIPTDGFDPATAMPAPGNTVRMATHQLDMLARRATSGPELVRSITALLAGAGAQGVWLVSRDQRGHWQKPAAMVEDMDSIFELLSNSMHDLLQSWGDGKDGAGLLVCEPPGLPSTQLYAAPIRTHHRVSEALVVLGAESTPSAPPLEWLVAVAAQVLSSWQAGQHVGGLQNQLAQIGGLLSLYGSLGQSTSTLDATYTLANELPGLWGCQQVVMVEAAAAGPRAVAVSGADGLDRHSAFAEAVESIVTCLPSDQPTLIAVDADPSSISGGERQLRKNELEIVRETLKAPGIAVVPFRNREGLCLAWAIAGFPAKAQDGKRLDHLTKTAGLLGHQLELVKQGHRSPWQMLQDQLTRLVRRRWVQGLAIGFAVFAIAMLVPWPYSVPCECRLELVRRRFVAAPWEGILQKSLVNNGDIVTQGQVLALMDPRTLRMEIASVTAELDRFRKEKDAALAKGAVSESQIAAAEVNRLESRLAILDARLENTEIRSPLAGVVVSGDLDKAEGVPMTTGKNLFEVGPLETLLVEVQIPEREVRMVRSGMPVTFELDAFPFRSFEGKLRRVHPRAETIDNESVFVAELEIENPDGDLRPGMQGRCRIRGDRYPLGYNLFHHAWEDARRWWVW